MFKMVSALGELADARVPQGVDAWAAIAVQPPVRSAALHKEAEAVLRAMGEQDGFEVMAGMDANARLLLHLAPTKASVQTSAQLRKIGRRVESRLSEPVWLGIGMPRASREGARRSANEAAESVVIARLVWSSPRSVLYSDVLPFLALSADRTLCLKLAKVLDGIESHDRRKRSKLLATLEGLVEESWSVAAASRNLRIHRHTVEYRLRKAESLLALDLWDGRDRFLIESAVAARRLILSRG